MSRYLSEPVLIPILLTAIVALGLYLLLLTGRISVGHGGFMLVGGYTSGLLSRDAGVPVLVSILAGGLLAAAMGLLLALLLRRLDGWSFAIATLAFGLIVQSILENWTSVGGPLGLTGMPVTVELPTILVFFTVACVFVVAIDRSGIGRNARAVRGRTVVAEAAGIRPGAVIVLLFAFSSALAGVSGGLYAHYVGIIRPEDGGFSQSLTYLTIVIVGGSDVWLGPLVGAGLHGYLEEALRVANELRFAVWGALIVVILFARPAGLITRNMWRRARHSSVPVERGRQGEIDGLPRPESRKGV